MWPGDSPAATVVSPDPDWERGEARGAGHGFSVGGASLLSGDFRSDSRAIPGPGEAANWGFAGGAFLR